MKVDELQHGLFTCILSTFLSKKAIVEGIGATMKDNSTVVKVYGHNKQDGQSNENSPKK